MQCICEQSYRNLEIIVSDNASPDQETEKVAREFMLADPRVQYFRQASNLGPLGNFEFVSKVAGGDYFMWMADDDWRDKQYIEKLLCGLQEDKTASVAFSDITVLDREGDTDHAFFPSYLPYLQRHTNPNKTLRLLGFYLQHEALGKANIIYGLFSRSALADLNLTNLAERFGFYGLDNLVVLHLLEKGRLALVHRKLYACTTGNVKHYQSTDDKEGKPNLRKALELIRYLRGYSSVNDLTLKLLFLALLPVKTLSILIGLGVPKKQRVGDN